VKLLLDIGNSRVKWALADSKQWLAEGASRLDEQHPDWPLLDTFDATPERVLAVNVAGATVAGALQTQVRSQWQLAVELAATGEAFDGLRNGYRNPQLLGADRWLAMLAARQALSGALCVVDAGTALTVDLIEADGRHLGGFILPGSDLMRFSLEQSTGDIRRRTEADAPVPDLTGPGRDTGSAIEAAGLQATLGLIDRAREMTSKPAAVVLSGGAAPGLLDSLPEDTAHRPRLVLEGLWLALAGRRELSGA